MVDTGYRRCLIVKTESYTREQVAKVVDLRANVEGLSLGDGVLDRLSAEGARRSLRLVMTVLFRAQGLIAPNIIRYSLQLLTPASILATLQGRKQITLEDVGEMNELFLDAKASAEAMA
jgi:RuvB-like protein 1